MNTSSSETHDPFVVASLTGTSTAIVGVTAYGPAISEAWRFVNVELDDGTSAITCTDLVQLVDVGAHTLDQPIDLWPTP